MPKSSYTAAFREDVGSTSGTAPLYLLEITHDQLAVPIRVVADTQDLISNGDTYTAYAFGISLPDDRAGQLPRANLVIDNLGQELTQWLDASGGGRGAQVRIMQVMRDAPDVIEYETTLDLLNVGQSLARISGELGYDDTLNQAGLAATYRPDNCPAIF